MAFRISDYRTTKEAHVEVCRNHDGDTFLSGLLNCTRCQCIHKQGEICPCCGLPSEGEAPLHLTGQGDFTRALYAKDILDRPTPPHTPAHPLRAPRAPSIPVTTILVSFLAGAITALLCTAFLILHASH